MNLRALVLTTSEDLWIERHFPEIASNLKNAKGVGSVEFTARSIHIGHIPTHLDADKDRKPDWEWLRGLMLAGDYNALVLHISQAEKKKHGITSRIVPQGPRQPL